MKYKYIIIVGCILLASTPVYGQTAAKSHNYGKIGITFSTLGDNEMMLYGNATLVGSTLNYDGKKFISFGLTYMYPVKHWLDIKSGITYAKQTVRVTPYVDSPRIPTPPPYNKNFSLIDIPLTLRFNFLHYFFAEGGLLFTIKGHNSESVPIQSGLGETFGIGARYAFKDGIGILSILM